MASKVYFSRTITAEKVLQISADSEYTGEVYLTVDGGTPVLLHSTDVVSVRRSVYYTELIFVQERNFYDIVDQKLIHNRG